MATDQNPEERFLAESLYRAAKLQLDVIGVDLVKVVENELFREQRSLFGPFGDSVKPAVELLERAAQRGHADASFALGIIVASDRSFGDAGGAPYLWKTAADQGHPLALYCLGKTYLDGLFCLEEDRAKALDHLIRSGEAGYSHAYWTLGDLYDQGGLSEKARRDPALAAHWYKKAANMGDGESQFALGELYESGRGVTRDYETACEWYGQAAKQKIHAAQLALGNMAEKGLGMARNYDEAANWYREVANRHDDFEPVSGDARCRLAWLLEMEYVPAKAGENPESLYRKAARGGNVGAAVRLFELWEMGHLIDEDGDSPMDWCLVAANHGDVQAQFRLGIGAMNREPPDLEEAIDWLSRAVDGGYKDAEIALMAAKRLDEER